MSIPGREGSLNNSSSPVPPCSQRQQIQETTPHRYVNHTSTSRLTPNHSHRLSGSSPLSSMGRRNLSQSYDSFDKLPMKRPNNPSAGNTASRLLNARPAASSIYSRHGSPTSSQSSSWINQTVLDDAAWMSEKIYNLQKNGFFRYPSVSKSSDRDEIHHSSQPGTPQSDVQSARNLWTSDQSSDHNFEAQDEYSEAPRNDEFLSAFKLSDISLTGDDDLLSDISPTAKSNTLMKNQSSASNMIPSSPTVTLNGDETGTNRLFTSLNEQGNSLDSSSEGCNSTNLVRSDLLSRLEALQYRAGLVDQESNASKTNHNSSSHYQASYFVDETQSNFTFPDDPGNRKDSEPMTPSTDSLSHDFESEISSQKSTESHRTLNDEGVSGTLHSHSSSRIRNRAEYYLPLSSEEADPILSIEARSYHKFPSPNKKASSRLSPRATISPLRLQPRSQMLVSQEEIKSHTKYDSSVMTQKQLSPASSKNRRNSLHGVNIMKPNSTSSIQSPRSPHAIYLPIPDYSTRNVEQLNRTRVSPLSPGSRRSRVTTHNTLKKMSNLVQSQDYSNAIESRVGVEFTDPERKSKHEEENSWISDENVENFLSSHSFSTKEDFSLNTSMHELLHVDHSLNLRHFPKNQSCLTATSDQNSAVVDEKDQRMNSQSKDFFQSRSSEGLNRCYQDECKVKTSENDSQVRNKIIVPLVNPADLVKCVIPLEGGLNPEGNYHHSSSNGTDLTSDANEMKEFGQANTSDSAIGRSKIHSRDLLIEEECFDLKTRPQIVRSLSFGEEETKTDSISENGNVKESIQVDRTNDEIQNNKQFESNWILDELKAHKSLAGFDTVDGKQMEIQKVSGDRIQESMEKNVQYSVRQIKPSKNFTVAEAVLVDHDTTETKQNDEDNISLASSFSMHLEDNEGTHLSSNNHPEVGRSFQNETAHNDEALEGESCTMDTWVTKDSLLIEETQLARKQYNVNNEPYNSSFPLEEPTNISSHDKHTANVRQKTSETMLSIYKNPLWMDETSTEFDDSVHISEAQMMFSLLNRNEENSLASYQKNMSLPTKSLDNIWSTYEGVAALQGTNSSRHEIDSYNEEGSAMMKIRKIDEEIQDLSLSILRSTASNRLVPKADSNEDHEQGKKHIVPEDLDKPVNTLPLPPSATIEVNVKGKIKEIVLSCSERNLTSSCSVNGPSDCNKTLDGSVLATEQAANSELVASMNAVFHENDRKMTSHLHQAHSDTDVLKERNSVEAIIQNTGTKPTYPFPPQPLHCKLSDISNQACQASNPVDVNEIREEVKQVTFIFSESKGTKEIPNHVELTSSLPDGHTESMASNWVCTFFSNARRFGCSCDQKTGDTMPQEDTAKLNKIEKRVEELEAEINKFKQENSNLQKLLKENETAAAWFAREKEQFQVFVVQKDRQIGYLQRLIVDLSNNMKELQLKVELNGRRKTSIAEVGRKGDQLEEMDGRKLRRPESHGQANHMDQNSSRKVDLQNKSQLPKWRGGFHGSPGLPQRKTR